MKEKLLQFLIDNGGKPDNMSWLNVAELFNFKPRKSDIKRGKAANDVWRYHLRTSKLNCRGTGKSYCASLQGTKLDKIDFNPQLQNMSISKAWQSASGDWRYSYKADNSVISEEDRNNILEDIKEFSPKADFRFVPIETDKNCALEISIPDLHIGQESVEKTRTKFLETIISLYDLSSSYANVERIIFPIGNDLLNSDNIRYTTTKGTQQFDVDDWRITFRAAWQMLVEAITWLSKKAPVYVIVVEGNHDTQRATYIGQVLEGWFHNDANVVINNDFNVFKFHQYGNNMIMYEHGELKAANYPLIMATEQPLMFAETKYREVHVGHIHKERVDEFRGVKVRFLPSIASGSRWEKKQGYKHQKCAQALLWHKTNGLISINQVNLD